MPFGTGRFFVSANCSPLAAAFRALTLPNISSIITVVIKKGLKSILFMPKTAIHPTYYKDSKVTCSCGATYTIGSTLEGLKVEVCRSCHPFYTGNQKLIDTAGRVDRFKEKMATAAARQAVLSKKKKPVEVVEEVEVKAKKATAKPVEAEKAEEIIEAVEKVEERAEESAEIAETPKVAEAVESTEKTEKPEEKEEA